MLYPQFDELVRMGSKPNRLDMSSRRPVLEAAFGNYASPFRGQGLSFQEVREYRAGDDIRNIDWRVTARTNKPHTKIFAEDRERTVMICVDANVQMRFGTRGTFKSIQAARATALIGRLANGSGDRVGCVLFGDVAEGFRVFRPTRSRRALWQALELLSRHEMGVYKDFVPMESALRRLDRISPTGTLVFMIAGVYPATENFEQNLIRLRRRCDVILVRINDAADGAIPSVGFVRFTDDNGETISLNTGDLGGQKAYAREWHRHHEQFGDLCARSGVHVIELHTDRDVQDDLRPALRRLQGRGRSS